MEREREMEKLTHIRILLTCLFKKLDFLLILSAENSRLAPLVHRQRVKVSLVIVPMAEDDVGAVLDLGRDVFEVVVCLSSW
ncbi:hypothetical protein RRF57_008529 [Xylaria bambusicola]|uniref:Uncharacterized protein n=1 Tax=Xylaria bambusicola TaxID=326684 RepID=A0AAN7UVH2_9PEZI